MYTPTIGLEVHAELKTKTKMFCGCKNEPHHSNVNQNICPVCMAHPGTLPVPNQEAVLSLVKFGVAVGGTVATYSEFDRKNYFYPDIPKAYQISQYAFPFVTGGKIAGVELTRVHLEEDTARSQHDKGDTSLVDFNRAGVPLLELVTEPVIHSAADAVRFAEELQLLLRTICISDANMELGEMRVEANISVSATSELGTKVEVKNLNSFRSVGQAIEYEIKRHIACLESGEKILQETRGWDEQKGTTFIQRAKETAKDYRYFPDPDLPKMNLSVMEVFNLELVKKSLPELPEIKRSKYSFLGLTSLQIEQIIANKIVDEYFAELVRTENTNKDVLQLAVNYLLTDVLPLLKSDIKISPDSFLALMLLLQDRKIGSRIAKDILVESIPLDTDIDMVAVLEERGLVGGMSVEALALLVQDVLARFPDVVAEYRAGKVTALQFLLGQIMKESKGKADPALAADKLKAELG